ncbi:S-adenosyl-l-methionine hydroxide adenosyltransferase family protein [Nodosilinea sp. PGN35]|uniref:SAM hydrolase/SAM-dependent halogenase family protein n=1 Tax=Nodosilinea sp. PGN35 TaxID=3020489 RepID=UPI0023B2FDB2|nr:SAM-dependent chlorinase/fluorinase [Nodosilinea sp. TSF1-S3]MDF0368854.1 SAM-dependent chlorinase/fluorinase [Nodosilinea sp. TSF1-S3]
MPIALLTDFGLRDSYVGVMKGVIATLAPAAQLIDLSHDLPPQDLYAARFTLLAAYPYLPPGTVYLVVVDPGVGTRRRAVAVQTAEGMLVGPDNGVLSGVWQSDRLTHPGILSAVELTNRDYWRSPHPSATFHGRDIFAPAAAHLANGLPLDDLGTKIDPQSLVSLPLENPIATATGWTGAIQYVDRFGNAATTIPASAVTAQGWTVTVGDRTLTGSQTYGQVPPGQGLALVGSHGFVELAVNQGSAQEQLGLAVGDRVSVNG